MKAVLADRNFRWFLGGQFLSIFGDTSAWLAMGIWVRELTGSNAEAGLTFFFFTLATLCGPLAGVVVDRMHRRTVLVWGNLAGAAVVLGLLAVHGRGQVWVIWLVAFLYGVVAAFLDSGETALLATMMPADRLADANGLLSTSRQGVRLFGPLVGAAIFAVAGGGVVAVIDAGTFVVAAGSLFFVRVDESAPVPEHRGWWHSVTAGAVHVWRDVVLRQVVSATALACVVIGFLETLGFAVVTDGLHRRASFLGVLITIQGIGAVLGGVTAAWLIRRIGEGFAVGAALVLAGGGCALEVSSSLLLVAPGVALLGLGLPWLIVALTTLMQRRTPNELQGRVSAAVGVLVTAPQTISIALGAALVAVFDYRLLLVVVAVVMAASGVLLVTRPEQHPKRRAAAAAADAAAAAAAATAEAGAGEVVGTGPEPVEAG